MTPQERHYARLGRNDRYAETDEDKATWSDLWHAARWLWSDDVIAPLVCACIGFGMAMVALTAWMGWVVK